MQRKHAKLICWAMVAIGAVAALAAAASRVRVEDANRTVAVILDHGQVEQLAAVSSRRVPEVLERLKAAGATDVAITEQTLHDALAGGDLEAETPAFRRSGMGSPTARLVGSAPTIERVRRALIERLGLAKRYAEREELTPNTWGLTVFQVRLEELEDLGVGYPSRAVHEVRQAGLGIVPRPRAEGNQWQAASDAALTLAEETGAKLVVFSGNAALGYPEALGHVADELRRRGLVYGYVEFGKQHGDAALSAKLAEDFVRVHSINETEMLGMSRQRALDRFELAVRERNIRACYLRLFAPSGPDPLGSAEEHVGALAGRLQAHGFELGMPEPHGALETGPMVKWLVLLAALGAAGLCMVELLGWRVAPVMVGVGAVAALGLVGMVAGVGNAAKLGALLGAVALPVYAVVRNGVVGALAGGNKGDPTYGRLGALAKGALMYVVTGGVSLVGALIVVGLLAERQYLLKLDQFSGVKVSQGGPLLLVLALLVGWELGHGDAAWERLVSGWRRVAETVVKYWHVVALLVGVGALGLLMLRSGNDSGVGVSGLELRFRALLDHVFGVRPRTKEVLIGHPFLMLALARLAAGKRQGLWALLTVGAIGQASMVNTFCHLHTPVMISVARTVHGLWLGAALGVALWLVVEVAEWVWGRARRTADV